MLALFVCYANSSPLLWSVYFAFEDVIAEQYCVNPENDQCNGKCHINSIDEDAPTQKSDAVKSELRFPEINEFIQNHFVLFVLCEATRSFNLVDSPSLLIGFSSDVFRPPTTA
jgi:hypothetical protein